MSQMIRLEAGDGTGFTVDIEIAKISKTIKNMLENLGMEVIENEAVRLPGIYNGKTLLAIIRWAHRHIDDDVDPEKVKANMLKKDIYLSDWDRELLEFERKEMRLLDVIRAASYLDIFGLVLTCSKYTALLIRGQKHHMQIRRAFKLKNLEVPSKPVQDTEASAMEIEEEKAATSSETIVDSNDCSDNLMES
ncbi:S-phase kinase-associated protein 1 [Nasonia vitripennis]|uniref:SKP1 component POZ domain-containing protein n=1 Tax=Nasonia vitripennis TaxID=7425 RepID=A0A7M7GBF5_NASVI|nr:S-phase kinase-associated protein 1 [Nasonia vitripennis]